MEQDRDEYKASCADYRKLMLDAEQEIEELEERVEAYRKVLIASIRGEL